MIPKSYREITLEKYQEVFPIVERILLEQDEDAKFNIEMELLEAFGLNTNELNIGEKAKYVKQLSFLSQNSYKMVHRHLRIKGGIYRAENKVDRLVAGQYVSIKELAKDGIIKNLHQIAPICYKKFKWRYKYKEANEYKVKYLTFVYTDDGHADIAEWFKKQPCHKILPLVFFCSNVLEHWMKSTTTYSTALKIIKARESEVQELLSTKNISISGDGSLQLTK